MKKGKLKITKERFCNILENFKKQHEIDTKISDAMEIAFDGSTVFSYDHTALSVPLLEILSLTFKDKSDWIGYFMYDLEFGTKYKPGMVSRKDQSDIPLATASDLYDLLMED